MPRRPASPEAGRQIRTGVSSEGGSDGEVLAEVRQARQVVGWREDVDVLEGRAHATRQRTVVLAAEQRIEPDHLARALLETLHRLTQDLGVAGVQTIAQDQHDRVPIDELL